MCILKYSLLILLFLQSQSWADTIYLKSGRSIQGTVLEEGTDYVIFDMAMGSVTYDFNKIDRIERDEKSNVIREEKKELAKWGESIQTLKRSVSGLYGQKGAVSNFSQKSSVAHQRTQKIEKRLLKKKKELAVATKALEPYAVYSGRTVIAQIYEQYMLLEARERSLQMEVDNLEAELRESEVIRSKADQKTAEAERNFLVKVSALEDQYKELIAKGCPAAALASIQRTLTEHGSVMERQEIQMRRRGDHFWLPVILNGRFTTEFMLDTGCSDMFLSPSMGPKLSISEDCRLGNHTATIADGSKIIVESFILESVTVGGFTVENVHGSRPVNVKSENFTPLLGMSFLSHFQFSIDMTNAKLILERVK